MPRNNRTSANTRRTRATSPVSADREAAGAGSDDMKTARASYSLILGCPAGRFVALHVDGLGDWRVERFEKGSVGLLNPSGMPQNIPEKVRAEFAKSRNIHDLQTAFDRIIETHRAPALHDACGRNLSGVTV